MSLNLVAGHTFFAEAGNI